MSATLFNFADLPMENLLLLQSACAAAIASRSGAALVVAAKEAKAPAAPKEPKAAKAKEPKEPKAPKAPGVAAAWLSHIVKARSEAYEQFKASSEKKQGVALLFAKEYRAQHADEYAAFELSFKEAHPSPPKAAPKVPEVSAEYAALTASLKGVFEAPAAPAPSVPSPNPFDEEVVEVQPAAPAAAEAKKARKPRKPMTAEEKAAMAAKKAATMAAKKAAEAAALLQQHAEDVRAE
jgi:hypothetical protein